MNSEERIHMMMKSLGESIAELNKNYVKILEEL
jgi:hypothetical protein